MGRRAAEGPRPPMGSPGSGSPWSAVLLAASILNSCFLPTQAEDIPVELVPNQPRKGDTITLTPEGRPDFVTCTWYRGEKKETELIFTYVPSLSEQQNGPAFTGRETAGAGCSLSIRNLAVNDSEIYTVSKTVLGDIPETGHVQLTVPEHDAVIEDSGGSSKPSRDKRGLGVGAIVGIMTGGLATTVLVGALVYYTVRHLRKGGDQAV